MFTGIIEAKGYITQLILTEKSLQIKVRSSFINVLLGESIAINGVCLTVSESTSEGEMIFLISPETLLVTNLGSLTLHSVLNLERALTLQTRVSGHWVQGHVDGKALLVLKTPMEECTFLQFKIQKELSIYCIKKGSICLNGISLTINAIHTFPTYANLDFMIIPHTYYQTNISMLSLGDYANIEVDFLGKYMKQFVDKSMEQTCQS